MVTAVSCAAGQFFLLYTSELFSILENKLIGYADGSTLLAVFHPNALRVAESPNRFLGRLVSGVTFEG